MKKILTSTILVSSLALGGCTGLGGSIFNDILGGGDRYGDGYNYNQGDRFERAAVEACGREAARYARYRITDVDQQDRDFVRVRGDLDIRDRDRNQFNCVFRSDNRIVEFRLY